MKDNFFLIVWQSNISLNRRNLSLGVSSLVKIFLWLQISQFFLQQKRNISEGIFLCADAPIIIHVRTLRSWKFRHSHNFIEWLFKKFRLYKTAIVLFLKCILNRYAI